MDLKSATDLIPDNITKFLPHQEDGKLDVNVNTIERVASGALGAFLLFSALKGGMIKKALLMAPAAALLKRAATGKCEIYQAAGISSVPEEGKAKSGSQKRAQIH